MRIDVDTNAAEVVRSLRFLFRDQVPFATSLAINHTAKGIQAVQRDGMRRRFTIRRPYVLQGVKVSKFSTKRDLEAIVEIDPSRGFLFKFEEGGTTRPRGTRFAVPDEVRRGKTGVVSRVMRPRQLKFKFHGSGPKAEVYKGEKRTFMIRKRDGSGAIFQRFGRRIGRTAGRRKLLAGLSPTARQDVIRRASIENARMLFSFTPKAQIEPSLEFEVTAQTVFEQSFESNFEASFDRAVRTAR